MNRKQLLDLLAKKNATLPAGRKLNPFGKSDAAIAAFVGVQLSTADAAANSKQSKAHAAAFKAVRQAVSELKSEGKPVTKQAVQKKLAAKHGKKLGALVATEGAVYAAGVAAGAVAGPVGVAVGGAATRAVIIGGRKVQVEMTKIKAESKTAQESISNNEATRRAIGKVAGEGIAKVKRVMSTLKSGEFLTELKHELGGDFAAPVIEETAHHFLEHHAEQLISASLGGGAAAVSGGMIVSKTVKAIDHALAHHKPLQKASKAVASAVSHSMHG
ncbi:hypothetical protein [Stenomitos frigidus]|uniref:Uncharacterized protein n=1 Tax=Stenomitos frigidus ULC18 TaxID=2107698 RepID=A0A2T1E0P3_9CYAN|nr:hypothetical protein [Stenomitos frigidus]PSB26194.1 hypothetical protein C7B82_20455 [Stenomitos frigidus ULC18]